MPTRDASGGPRRWSASSYDGRCYAPGAPTARARRPTCGGAASRPAAVVSHKRQVKFFMSGGKAEQRGHPSDQVIRENPASRGTETSAEVLVGPPWRMECGNSCCHRLAPFRRTRPRRRRRRVILQVSKGSKDSVAFLPSLLTDFTRRARATRHRTNARTVPRARPGVRTARLATEADGGWSRWRGRTPGQRPPRARSLLGVEQQGEHGEVGLGVDGLGVELVVGLVIVVGACRRERRGES